MEWNVNVSTYVPRDFMVQKVGKSSYLIGQTTIYIKIFFKGKIEHLFHIISLLVYFSGLKDNKILFCSVNSDALSPLEYSKIDK